MFRLLFAGWLLLTSVAYAIAQPVNSKKETEFAAVPSTQSQRDFARKLDEALLSDGFNIRVNVWSAPEKNSSTNVPFPALHLFGPLSTSLVFNIVRGFTLIKEAKKLEFKTLQFQSSGSGGVYTFDIRQPGPTGQYCARDLCFD